MAEYFDTLETRPHELREEQLFAGLRGQLVHARQNSPHFGRSLPDMPMRDRSDLAGLPVLRKSDLIGIQRAEPPFGGLVAAPMAQLGRIFQSPGP
ncbi:MAG: phenylacetate--CoA ligase family protein, partial [Rhodospirillales bacterium]|nr:phenylacetate--CoA ligase family protein [Rhodospirillales bacterium]